MTKGTDMKPKDREALIFAKALPVYPETISRRQLALDLDLTEGQLAALIYRMTWYLPIAEDVSRGLCWPAAGYRETACEKIRNGEIEWMESQKTESALRKKHGGGDDH